MKKEPENHIQITLLLSIAVHVVFFLLLQKSSFFNALQSPMANNFSLEVIEPSLLEKMRLIGTKDGQKDLSLKVAQEKNLKESLSLNDLSAKYQKTQNNPPTIYQKRSSSDIELPNYKSSKEFQDSNVLRSALLARPDADILANASLRLQVLPTQGVKEDELNSSEKMFYSFHRRAYIAYVNSFFSAYNNMLNTRPSIKNTIMQEQHSLMGKVVFDRDGNIISIKILDNDDSKEMNNLFENTLSGIKALYNPPEMLVKDQKEFTIFYRLNINL